MSISLKLVVVVTLCLGLAVGGLALMGFDFFQKESLAQAKRETAFAAQMAGQDLSRELNTQVQKMSALAHLLEAGDLAQSKAVTIAINSQEALLSFGVYKPIANQTFAEIYFTSRRDGLNEFQLQPTSLGLGLLPAIAKSISEKTSGVSVINSSLVLKKPIVTLAFFNEKHWLVKSEIPLSFFKDFLKNSDNNTLFIIDENSVVLSSSNIAVVAPGTNIANSGIISALKSGSSNSIPLNYTDDQGQLSVGAFDILPSGLVVISQTDQGALFLPLEKLRYRGLLVSLIALGLSWIVTILFASKVTDGLTVVYNALMKVAGGQLQTNLDVLSNDEIGGVASAFKKMIFKLQDRDRLKGTLFKFSAPEDADKLLAGEIKLSTDKRRMTVLFIEIYDFANESSSSEEMFRQLNSFWGEVGRIIKKYLGFIDKTDTQMMRAVWGALGQINDEGSSSLSAALEIRKAIQKFNERRESKNQPHVKFGIGIHTGDVTPGHLGTDDRTEYTFAGQDMVMASRVASLNPFFNSDILVSEDTQILLKNKGYVFGPSITSEDSGLSVRQVIGRKKNDGELDTDLSRAEQDEIKSGSGKFTLDKDGPTSFSNVAQGFTEIQENMPGGQSPRPSPAEAVTVMGVPNNQTHYNFEATQGGVSIKPQMVQGPQQTQSQFFVQTNAVPLPESTWYLMRSVQSGVAEGPFSLDDLRKIAEQPGFQIMEAYAYRFNDTMMTPLMQVPNLSRRQSAPPIPQTLAAPPSDMLERANAEEWFIQREDGRVYGPYRENQLVEFLETGHMTRTTYCWRKGMTAWVYAFQLPGVDRRGSTPPPPPLPIPAKAG